MADGNINMRVSVVETEQIDRLKQQMDRIEFKLDQLLDVLAGDEAGDEDAADAVRSLDDGRTWPQRDQNESLG